MNYSNELRHLADSLGDANPYWCDGDIDMLRKAAARIAEADKHLEEVEERFSFAEACVKDRDARLAAAEAAVKEERTSRAAAYIALRAIRIELVAWVLRNMDSFGCFSGDCPHDTNSECIESIVQQYEEDVAAK